MSEGAGEKEHLAPGDGAGKQEHLASVLTEARDDVRSYGTLLIQLVLLILTTVTLATGWFATGFLDGIREAADRAVRAGSPADSGAEAVSVAGEKLAAVLMLQSPTTSLLLVTSCFYVALLLGLIVVIFYMVQRRRFWSHEIAREAGMKRDTPVIDPVLTSGSLSVLIGVVAAPVLLLYGFVPYQVIVRLHPDVGWVVRVGLLVLWVTVGFKIYCTGALYLNFRDWEREIGWNLRWPEALQIVAKLTEGASREGAHAQRPDQFLQACRAVYAACEKAVGLGDSHQARKLIWESSIEHNIRYLITRVHFESEAWRSYGEQVMTLAYVLRVAKGLRYSVYGPAPRSRLLLWRLCWGARDVRKRLQAGIALPSRRS